MTAKAPPFTVLVDTREQREFRFHGLATTVGTLKTGDYSLVGYQDRVAVERKSKADIWMCCATERPRFERCLERLAALERACVVIECDLRELSIRPEYIQRVTPATVIGSCISWSCKYRLPFYWCDTRAYAERVTVRFLAAFLKHVADIPPVEPPCRQCGCTHASAYELGRQDERLAMALAAASPRRDEHL